MGFMMTCSTLRGTLAAFALAGLAAQAPAFLILDDFTEGGFAHRLTGTQNFGFDESGLDPAHSAWGRRALRANINSNPNNTYLDFGVGAGRQYFESPEPVMWMSLLLLGGANREVDLSDESEIWLDLATDPRNALADNWDILVRDVHGVDASNGGWFQRGGGIRFRKQGFSRQVDWSRIETFQFTQNWDSLPNPLAYEVTRIYAVPEPCTAAGAAVLGFLALRKRRARRGRS